MLKNGHRAGHCHMCSDATGVSSGRRGESELQYFLNNKVGSLGGKGTRFYSAFIFKFTFK